jgi:hypothetical protein
VEVSEQDTAVDIDPLLEAAWGLIANAGGGNWEDTQTHEWMQAAERWRDEYFNRLHGERGEFWTNTRGRSNA